MEEVTAAQISALLLEIQSRGQAHSSVVRIYAILNGFFKMAYQTDDIPKNPMDKVPRPTPRKGELKKGEPESYTEEELFYILDCLKSEPLKWQVMLCLLIETGMRRGECCGLQWENINFKTMEITIVGSLSYTSETGIYLDTPKTSRVRTVDITPSTASMLRKLRQEQSEKALSKWVFTQEKSSDPMFPDSPTKYMESFAKRYGIEHLHPHKLRHSFASIAITNGADVVSVSEILGHSDSSTTLRIYSHASKESRKKASDIFQNAVQNTQNKYQSR